MASQTYEEEREEERKEKLKKIESIRDKEIKNTLFDEYSD